MLVGAEYVGTHQGLQVSSHGLRLPGMQRLRSAAAEDDLRKGQAVCWSILSGAGEGGSMRQRQSESRVRDAEHAWAARSRMPLSIHSCRLRGAVRHSTRHPIREQWWRIYVHIRGYEYRNGVYKTIVAGGRGGGGDAAACVPPLSLGLEHTSRVTCTCSSRRTGHTPTGRR